MGMAFGISEDDVQAIVSRAGIEISDARASEILGMLNHDLVEAAALHFDDMDEQTESAYDEIRRQMGELGLFGEVFVQEKGRKAGPSPDQARKPGF